MGRPSRVHATHAPEERAAHGFSAGLIRLSVGLENYDNIRLDILTALEQMS
ncbi:PLP-dependent transferase [Roseixanthobacter glucoisosaccharinicivorans]|uniref:PLP-dependent transferase n=1 Tax=Roseixanthobacter glucoisosaccharinicivorans TaxID=3119923 RepID=UPI0037289E40